MLKSLVALCVLALLHAPTVRCQEEVEQASVAAESEGTLSTDDFVTPDDVTILATDEVTSEVTDDATSAVIDVTSPGVNIQSVAACEDKERDCLALGYSTCTAFVSWAAMYCARSCNMCNGVTIEGTLNSSDFPDFTFAISTSNAVEESTIPTEQTETTTTETTPSGPLIPDCCKDQAGWETCITHKQESCVGIYRPWAGANCQAFCGFCQPCPIEPCEDRIQHCEQYGEDSCSSESYFIWAITNCRKTCNLCVNYGFYYKLNPNVTIPTMPPDQPAVVDSTSTAQSVTTTRIPTGQCEDRINHCSEYGKNDCVVYEDFMGHYCPRFCGICTPESECQDRLQNCTHYLEEYCCGIYEPWARHNCASYCGFCGVPPSRNCTDSINYCDREPDDLCTKPSYRLFRMENCAGFCKLCETPWVPPSCAAHLYNVSVTVPETTSSN